MCSRKLVDIKREIICRVAQSLVTAHTVNTCAISPVYMLSMVQLAHKRSAELPKLELPQYLCRKPGA